MAGGDDARAQVVAAVKGGGFGFREVFIRINGIDTPWHAEDLAAAAHCAPDAILVPKVASADTLELIGRRLLDMATDHKTRVWAMIETPLAIFNVLAIAAAARDSESRLAGLVMGTNDLAKDTRARLVPGSHLWPDRWLTPAEQMAAFQLEPQQIAYAEMPAGSAVVYSGGTIHAGGANTTQVARRGAHLSYCLGWLRTEENNYLSTPPAVAARLPRRAQELLGYALHDSISRGGGYLGMVRMQDPVELLARGELGA